MPDPTLRTLSATETPALFGASPYTTKWMLYQKFANGLSLDKEESSRMDWGKKMQPVILDHIASERGLEVIPNPSSQYVSRGLLGCTRDATIISPGVGPGALEIKCVFDYKIWMQKWDGGNVVPREIEMQLQQQMYVGEGDGGHHYQWGCVAVWVCADLYYFDRKPMRDLWVQFEDRAGEFFADVRTGKEPDPFGHPAELPLMMALFPTRKDSVLDLSEDANHVQTSNDVGMYLHYASELTGTQAAKERLRLKLLALSKDYHFVKLPCGVSYRVKGAGKGKTIDAYVPEVPTAPPTPRDPLLAGG